MPSRRGRFLSRPSRSHHGMGSRRRVRSASRYAFVRFECLNSFSRKFRIRMRDDRSHNRQQENEHKSRQRGDPHRRESRRSDHPRSIVVDIVAFIQNDHRQHVASGNHHRRRRYHGADLRLCGF